MSLIQPVRVLFIVPSLSRGGAEAQLVDLVNGLDTTAFEVHLLCFQPYLDQLKRLDQGRVKFHHVLRGSRLDWSVARKVAEVVDQHSIDIIHATLQYSLLYGWLGRALAKKHPKIVAALHTTISSDFKEEMQNRLVYQWLLRQCHGVIFVCNKQRDYWVAKYPFLQDISTVIHNGVDADWFKPDSDGTLRLKSRETMNIPANAFVVVCVALFRKEKGQQYLVKAAEMLGGSIFLLFAGDGSLRPEIERQAREAGITEYTRFMGLVDDVRKVLHVADLSVIPSTAVETFSIAMLESLSMCVPVLGSDIGGMSEAVIPEVTGMLVAPGDVDDLVQQLKYFLDHRDRVKEMGNNGRNLVRREFSKEKMVVETARLLSTI